MRSFLFILFIMLFVLSWGNVYSQIPEMTIREATEVPVDSLLKLEQLIEGGATPGSVFELHYPPTYMDTIIVTGVITVDPYGPGGQNRRVLQLGNAVIVHIQDPDDPEWGGLHIRENDTTTLQTGIHEFGVGDIVQVTGRMEEFPHPSTPTSTQMVLLKDHPVVWLGHVDDVDTLDQIPFIELPVSEFVVGSGPDRRVKFSTGERWKGARVQLNDVRVISRTQAAPGARWAWWIRDEDGNEMYVYDSSKYFRGGPEGADPDWEPPPLNALIDIRGIMMTQAIPATSGYAINPVMPGDIVIKSVPPVIEDIQRNIVIPLSTEDVEVTARVLPPSEEFPVDSVFIFYTINGGDEIKVEMNLVGDDTYSATIPAQDDKTLVTYYIAAYSEGDEAKNPADPTRRQFFYRVLDDGPRIFDVQYTPYSDGLSFLVGEEVTVSGVVTTDRSDVGFVIMQDGQGPWNGVWIHGVDDTLFVKGDSVTVTGLVQRFFDFTRITEITEDKIEIHQSGVALPEPELLTTGIFATGARPAGHPEAEPWAGVLVRFENLTITDDDPDANNHVFREFVVNDGSGGMRVDDGPGGPALSSWIPTYSVNPTDDPTHLLHEGATIDQLNGIMYFSFGNYKLVPRNVGDFVGVTKVEEKITDEVPREYFLSHNYPNPFNPSTTINFQIPKSVHVSLKVYNVLGQEVAVLVDEFLHAGNYETTLNASNIASGVYFYRMVAGDFTEVKRMIYLK